MSVALATKGVIGGFIAAGRAEEGDPYPLPIEDIEVEPVDISLPELDVDPVLEDLTPIGFDEVEYYLPQKKSTISHLPANKLVSFPKPNNL